MGHLNYNGRNYPMANDELNHLSNNINTALETKPIYRVHIYNDFIDECGVGHRIESELFFSAGVPFSVNRWDVKDSDNVFNKDLKWTVEMFDNSPQVSRASTSDTLKR